MKTVTSLISAELLEKLATRSHFRYGREMAEEGVRVLEKTAYRARIEVSYRNSRPQTVELISAPKGLRFKCSCSSKKSFFCPHAVAAAWVLAELS